MKILHMALVGLTVGLVSGCRTPSPDFQHECPVGVRPWQHELPLKK